MVVVAKFGGGILKDGESFRRIVRILAAKKEPVVVVVSAAGSVTDSLVRALDDAVKGRLDPDAFTSGMLRAHELMLQQVKDAKIREGASMRISEKVSRLNKLLYGVLFLKEVSPRVYDLINSFGERLSATIMEAYLLDGGVNAKAFEADEIGVLTTSDFGKARPLLEKTKANLEKNVRPFLRKGIPVITGYFGVDEEGNVTTFGRGGSDLSAGVVANALDADELEIWKDVEGFMSADPRVVRKAKKLDLLSYDEAEELGYFGAKILHPKTIAPIRAKKIPAVIKNVFEPSMKGTLISEEGRKAGEVAKSVAVKREMCMLAVKGAEVPDVSRIILPIFSKLSEQDVAVNAISTSEIDLSFVFDEKDLQKVRSVLENLETIEETRVEDDVSLVGLIGEGMKFTPGISGRLFTCLGRAGVNVRMISQGASEINISLVVKRSDADAALAAIHAEFMEG